MIRATTTRRGLTIETTTQIYDQGGSSWRRFFVAAVILGTIFAPTNGTIEFELLKFIMQFLLIVALGAVVAVGVEVVKRLMVDRQYLAPAGSAIQPFRSSR